MVKLFVALATAGIALGGTAIAEAAPKWVAIETTHYAWHKGTAPYALAIEEDRSGVGQGDETSPRLVITAPGGKTTMFAVEGGWVTLADDPPLVPPVKDNLLHSKYLYLTTKLTNAEGEPMLFVFGQAYASDAGSMRVIALDAMGMPHVVLAEETYYLMAIADLDRDGTNEVIGMRTLSQVFNDCTKTYDPISVFKFNAAHDALVHNEALSKAYMAAHHLGWAGPKVREDIGVSTCGANKGRVVPKPAPPQ